MALNPILSPTAADTDLLILEGVLAGVQQHGARYGLTHPRRDLLALTLHTLLASLQGGWEGRLRALLTDLQAGRPSQPTSRPQDEHQSRHTSLPQLARRAGSD